MAARATVHQTGDEITDLSLQTSDRQLFQAILLRQFSDACGCGMAGVPPKYRFNTQVNARRWLLHNKRDFDIISTAAGFDADEVREHVRRLAATGWPADALENNRVGPRGTRVDDQQMAA